MIDFFLCDSPIIIVSPNVFTEKLRLILVLLFDFRFRKMYGAHIWSRFGDFRQFFGRLQKFGSGNAGRYRSRLAVNFVRFSPKTREIIAG